MHFQLLRFALRALDHMRSASNIESNGDAGPVMDNNEIHNSIVKRYVIIEHAQARFGESI